MKGKLGALIEGMASWSFNSEETPPPPTIIYETSISSWLKGGGGLAATSVDYADYNILIGEFEGLRGGA